MLYSRHGVRDYWKLHPADRMLTICVRQEDGGGSPEVREARGRIAIRTLGNLEVDFDLIFESVAGLE